MKKIAYLMTAVIASLGFIACSNDDNSAYPDATSKGAVITINTASLYEEAGITEEINKALAGGLVIIDSVLIYNEDGHLVTKLGTTTKDLKPLTIKADNLPNGKYTLIAWQTAYTDNEEERYQPCEVDQEEEIANVMMSVKGRAFDCTYAFGMASATVTVSGNSLESNISPKLIGSIIDFRTERDIKENGYILMTLLYRKYANYGYYLDPARTDDHWIGEELVDIVRRVAELKEGELHHKFYTLQNEGEKNLALRGYKTSDSDEDLLYAYHQKQPANHAVYYIDLNRLSIMPPFFGTEEDFATWKASYDAGALPIDPYIKWGGNFADVENHVHAKNYWVDGNSQIELWENTGWHKWYLVSSSITEQYLFGTEDGQNLLFTFSVCNDPNLSLDAAHNWLKMQGYTFLGLWKDPYVSDSYYNIFLSADGQTEVATNYMDETRWCLQFYPLEPGDIESLIPADQPLSCPAKRSCHRLPLIR